MDGGGKYQLTKLNDQKYQKKLVELNKSCISLKEEIQKVREDGYENTNIIEMSEMCIRDSHRLEHSHHQLKQLRYI